jgi:hypothetical protein
MIKIILKKTSPHKIFKFLFKNAASFEKDERVGSKKEFVG